MGRMGAVVLYLHTKKPCVVPYRQESPELAAKGWVKVPAWAGAEVASNTVTTKATAMGKREIFMPNPIGIMIDKWKCDNVIFERRPLPVKTE